MEDNHDDSSLPDLDLHKERRKPSEESKEESDRAQRKENLEEEKARGKHNRSEMVKDHLAYGMIAIIYFLVACTFVVTGSLVCHYAIWPHLSEVHAEVLKGALASFTILNAALIITKTIDLN